MITVLITAYLLAGIWHAWDFLAELPRVKADVAFRTDDMNFAIFLWALMLVFMWLPIRIWIRFK